MASGSKAARIIHIHVRIYPRWINPPVSWPHPACRGAPLERRLDGGAGWRRDRRAGPQLRQPAPGNSGPRAGAAPALPARNRYPGGVGTPPGALRSPARSWLTIGRCAIDESAARRRKERRRSRAPKGAPARVSAGDLRRSGDRSDSRDGPSGAAFRTSACRRSAPPHLFLGSGKGRRAPGARSNRAMMLGCLTTETDCRAGKARRACPPPPRKNGGHASLCPPYGIYVEGEISAKPPASQNPPMPGKTLTPC